MNHDEGGTERLPPRADIPGRTPERQNKFRYSVQRGWWIQSPLVPMTTTCLLGILSAIFGLFWGGGMTIAIRDTM